MANNRIHYGCQSVGIAPYNTSTYTAVRGLQTAGLNTTFKLEPIYEISQLDMYENAEDLPEVEITLEKCLDGYAPLYTLLTMGAAASTIAGRSNMRANVALSIFDDTLSLASGTPIRQTICSGVFVSQFSYDFTVNGPFKESVTAVGNNKVWTTGSPSFTFTGFSTGIASLSPAAPEGVNRRQDFIMASSRFPTDIPGISSSGTNNVITNGNSTQYAASLQNVKVSVNLNRNDLLELGRRGPYFKYVGFPVPVTSSFEIISKEGDMISATEDGILSGGSNVSNQTIYMQTQEGLKLDLGTKNKLQSVTYGGANAGQGNAVATCTFNYSSQNLCDVKHVADPTTGIRLS